MMQRTRSRKIMRIATQSVDAYHFETGKIIRVRLSNAVHHRTPLNAARFAIRMIGHIAIHAPALPISRIPILQPKPCDLIQ